MHAFTGGVAARRREMVHTAMLVLLDSLAMLSAFSLARSIRGSSAKPFAHMISGPRFAAVMICTVPLWVFIFSVCKLYALRVDGGRVSEVGRVIAAVLGVVMSLIFIDYLSFGAVIFPSHSVPLIGLLIGMPLVVIERQMARKAMKLLFRRGKGLHNVILIGTGDLAHRIAHELIKPTSGYRVVAAVSGCDDGGSMPGGVPVYSTLERAISAVPTYRIDEIIQADLDIRRSSAVKQMAFANSQGIGYRFVPDQYGVYAAASTMSTIDGVPLMEVRLTSLEGWGAVGKRIFDLVGALVLLAMLWPVLVVVAVGIKLCEPAAPVLYTQRRVGLRGKDIPVLKFRTMSWKYSTGPDRPFQTAEAALSAMGRADLIPEFRLNQKVTNDPRVSRLGKVLRRTSLDELPQLFNALRGDLSLVGPRPITQDELDRYGDLSLVGPRPITQDELDRYGDQAMSFLALKPGITGLWQVYGRSSTTYEERVKLDIFYVENWSLGMDVSILARTVVSVAARKGAV